MKHSVVGEKPFILCCPNCREKLLGNRCTKCLYQYKIDENGIYRLTSNNDFYYREKMPRTALQRVINATDIYKATYEIFKNELKWKYDFYSFDSTRGIGTILSNLSSTVSVLDYGAGWGNIVKFMSNYVAQAAAIDMTYESLYFAKRTCPNQNITFFHGGDGKYLPFCDSTFDLVVINGVLEWIPDYVLEGDPFSVQLSFLKEIRRVLKPEGQILVAIENRIWLGYFLGVKEDHSGIKYASLLPRKIANMFSQKKNKKPFRTYTYTRSGYKNIFNLAGFHNVEFNIPYPDYRNISQLFPGKSLTPLKTIGENITGVKRLKTKFITHPWIRKYFCHSFLIISSSKDKSFLENILKNKNEKISDVEIIQNQSHKGTIFVSTKVYVYKIPTSKSASENISYEVDAVSSLKEDKVLKCFLPDLEKLVIKDMNILISKKEQTISKFVTKDVDIFFKHKDSKAVEISLSKLKIFNKVKTLLCYNNKSFLYDKFINFLGDSMVKCSFAHGDFHSKNMLVTKKGIKIIDWEYYKEVEPIEIDYLNLLLFEEAFLNNIPWSKQIDHVFKKSFRISSNNAFKKYGFIFKEVSPQILMYYYLRYLDNELNRYENVSFIPFQKNEKYLRHITNLQNMIL